MPRPPIILPSIWMGRFGNNIQQVLHGIMVAKKRGASFMSLPHPLINTIKWGPCPDDGEIVRLGLFSTDVIDERARLTWAKGIAEEFIAPNLNVPPPTDPIGEDTLVIHVRSGDIFKDRGYPSYVMNPLVFFTRLVNKYPKTIIVSEDEGNPVIKILKKMNGVEFVSSTVAQDYSTLMRATNLATSGVGTFGISAALCSKNIKRLHVSNIYEPGHICPLMFLGHGLEIEMSYIDSSYIRKGEWFNRPDQIRHMLGYHKKIPTRTFR